MPEQFLASVCASTSSPATLKYAMTKVLAKSDPESDGRNFSFF